MPTIRSTILPTALLLVATVAACQRPPAGPAEIRVGVIAPFTGSLADRVGDYAREGLELAAESINGRGGLEVAGRRLRVVMLFEDSEDRPEAAVEAARKLINQDRVAVLIGPFLSRNALAAAAVAEAKATPMISPASTHVELTAGRRFVFRATITDDLQGQALALFAREALAARRAAMLYDVASAHNRSVAEFFRGDFERAGGEVVAAESYTTGERDFRAALARIHAAVPEVLLLPNYPDELPLQVRQARQQGIAAVFLGSDSWDADVYLDVADLAGSYFTEDWLPGVPDLESVESSRFVMDYGRRYGRSATTIAALAYDALGLAATAIERTGSLDPVEVARGLRTTVDYRGVTGILSFRGNGDPVKAVGVFRIGDGRLEFYKLLQPRW